MSRPRRNDPTALLRPIIEEFASKIAAAIELRTTERIKETIQQTLSHRGAHKLARRTRGTTLCYYPGCKNVAAPRFGMFCAAEHKTLSKTDKKKHREQHAQKRRSGSAN